MDPRIGTRRVHPSVRTAGAFLAAAGLVAVTFPTGAASAWHTTAAPSAVVSAHSSVIAQRVVTFEEGPHHWSIDQRPLEPAAEPAAWSAPAPEFVIAARGTVIVTAGADTYLIATGEAAFVAPGTEVTAAAVGAEGAVAYLIHVVAGDPTGAPTEVGGAFTPGAGAHDVDLLGLVLDAGQTADLPPSPAAPVLAFVTSGAAEANGDPLAAGEAASMDGAITFANTSDGQSIAVALSIGAVFDGGTPPEPVTTDPTDDGDDDDDDGGSEPTTTEATAPTTDETTTTLPIDTDDDDLTDSEEAAAGSNPAVPDTDSDGLWDGLEVHQHNTSPLSKDTDNDGLNDLDETSNGTDGRTVDSDGDGLSDGQEVHETGSNPLKLDTDGDGLNDVEELAFSTSLTNPDTDGDGMSDGDEARIGSDPTVANG